MKKRYWAVLAILILLFVCMLATGGKRYDVYISDDLTVSEDGTGITLHAGVSGSMGYLRTYKSRQEGDSLYLTFYSTFGLNSRLGTKDEFEVSFHPPCKKIYVNGGDAGFKLVMELNQETGEWYRTR